MILAGYLTCVLGTDGGQTRTELWGLLWLECVREVRAGAGWGCQYRAPPALDLEYPPKAIEAEGPARDGVSSTVFGSYGWWTAGLSPFLTQGHKMSVSASPPSCHTEQPHRRTAQTGQLIMQWNPQNCTPK